MFPGMERNVAQTTTFGQLLGAQPVAEREAIRQIEKCNQKLNNAEVALAFNLDFNLDRKFNSAFSCMYLILLR